MFMTHKTILFVYLSTDILVNSYGHVGMSPPFL